MSSSSFKSSLPGIFLGLISAAFMLHALSVHPQETGGMSAPSQQGSKSSGTSSGAAGGAGSGMSLSRTDEKLIKQLAEASLAEINAGKLAEEKSQNDQVKSFARKMVDDHTNSLNELKQLAQAKGMTLPTEPDRQQRAMEKRLSSLSGEKFDKQYMEQAGERSHKDTHKLLQQASTKAQDTDLKNYASKTLGVVETHQQMAKETSKMMESSSHGKSGAGTTGGSQGGKGPAGKMD